jgi:hypothetical protein
MKDASEREGAADGGKKQALVTLEWTPVAGRPTHGHYGSAKPGLRLEGTKTEQGQGQGQSSGPGKRGWLADIAACCKSLSRCCRRDHYDVEKGAPSAAASHGDAVVPLGALFGLACNFLHANN